MILYTSVYGISALTVLKASAGFVIGVSVTTSGASAAATGAVYDAPAVSGAVALGPLAIVIPSASGLMSNIPSPPGWFCEMGITVQPASGQVLNVMYQ